MKRLLLLVLLALLIFVSPAVADVDHFTIKTFYGSPTQYLIDYGELTTAYIYNYSIESSTNLATNQTWLLLGSNNQDTIYELDNQTSIAFTATVLQNFTITIPNYYRFYYLVVNDGFYNPLTVLTLTLYSNTITIPSPYVTITAAPVAGIPMLPAAPKQLAPVQWVSDWMLWVVIALLIVVVWLVLRRR